MAASSLPQLQFRTLRSPWGPCSVRPCMGLGSDLSCEAWRLLSPCVVRRIVGERTRWEHFRPQPGCSNEAPGTCSWTVGPQLSPRPGGEGGWGPGCLLGPSPMAVWPHLGLRGPGAGLVEAEARLLDESLPRVTGGQTWVRAPGDAGWGKGSFSLSPPGLACQFCQTVFDCCVSECAPLSFQR